MPVTLFYKYFDERQPRELAQWMTERCEECGLTGRIRVASEGVNGTLGGDDVELHAFERALAKRIGDVDYKHSPGNACAFGALSVRLVDELVTLGVARAVAPWRNAAPALSPADFLAEVRGGKALVLDVRNAYETAIGHFRNAVLPRTRTFADLPAYLSHPKVRALFGGQRVLMYCTGGVRCETASALLRNVARPESVAQLHGGIHRFLEAYEDGAGVFLGKNLVFDGRGAVPAVGAAVVGRCAACGTAWDDYAHNARCAKCRTRILICSAQCHRQLKENGLDASCELCPTLPTEKKRKLRGKRRVRWEQKENYGESQSGNSGSGHAPA